MSSFWTVKEGKAMEHVGRPTKTDTTSFAVGCGDEDYLAAGLFKHVNWEGTYDPRTQELSTPRFVVRSDLKEVQTHYDVWEKTPEQIAGYDAEALAGMIGGLKQSASDIILAAYPLWRQSNALMGVYGTPYLDKMRADIAAVVAESNDAEAMLREPVWPSIGPTI